MIRRRYYEDAYTHEFDAVIEERFEHEGCLALVLDQTYFYPTSGGQPADGGTINGASVVDVFVRETDGAVVHVVDGEVWTDEIRGELDWDRRFDHMQQHSGQHILSQAFIQVAGAETVGFHLSEATVTIDLDRNDLQPESIEAAESLANRIIWQDRPIKIHLVSLERAQTMNLRKLPEVTGNKVRLIDIEHFDVTACGGTHVARTGAVGMIKILKLEQRADQLRIEFKCGKRALNDYRQKNRIITRLATDFTTGYWEVEQSVAKLRDDLKQLQRQNKQQRTRMMSLLAEQLLLKAATKSGIRVVKCVLDDQDGDDMKVLAGQLIARENVVALLGLAGTQTRLLFARSEKGQGEMNSLLKPALQVLGNATGGGSPTYAQGGGPAAGIERVQQAVDRAERLLLAQIR